MSKISIAAIVPFHGEDLDQLEAAVNSVILQSYPCDRIFIIDNSSGHLAALHNWSRSAPNIEVISTTPNLGAAAARNIGVQATQEFSHLAFLDADDTWEEAKLSLQVQHLEKNGLMCSSTSFLLFRGEQKILRPKNPKPFSRSSYSNCHLGLGSTLLIQRSFLVDLGNFNEQLRRFEDWDLAIRIRLHGTEIEVLKDPLSRVNRIPNSNWSFAEESLAKMSGIYRNIDTPKRLKILSGIFLEKAVIRYRNKKILSMVWCLISASVLDPKNAFYITQILTDRLKSKIDCTYRDLIV